MTNDELLAAAGNLHTSGYWAGRIVESLRALGVDQAAPDLFGRKVGECMKVRLSYSEVNDELNRRWRDGEWNGSV